MKRSKIGRIMGDCHYNRIIMLLYFSGRKSKTEIYNAVSTNPRIPRKLQFLLEEGYISMVQEGPGNNPRNMVDLTPLGMTLAEGLCSLEESLGGDVDRIRRSYSDRGMDGEIRM